MKGMKKVLVGFLASVSVFAGSLGLAGCEFSSSSSDDSKHLQQLYSQYVVYVKVMGQEPLVYKEWLTMIKENANVEIEKVEIDEDGNLVITYTDGTVQTLEVPKEEHIHSFGDWALSATGGEFCEDKLYFRTCADCGDIEWKQGAYTDHNWTVVTTNPTCKEQGFDTKTCGTCGKVEKENYTETIDHDWTVVTTDPTCQEQGFDTKTCETCGKVEKGNYKPASHAWATTYSSDNSYHWLDCENCDEIKDKQEHTIGVSGECSVCHEVFSVMEGVLYEVSADGTYAEVIGYQGTAEKVLIAEMYNGVPVTAIAERAFYNCTNITSIVVPNSVTSIGYEALRGCTSLTEVTLPFVGGSASDDNRFVHIFGHSDEFDDYNNYTYDYTPNSLKEVTITGGEISDWAFAWCIAQTVILGDGVTSIGECAFYCSGITEIVIPSSVTSIGFGAFTGCGANVYITDIVAWCNISRGQDFEVDMGAPSLSLYLNNELLTDLVIPDSVTKISSSAFSSCDSLTSVTIGDGVTTIGDRAFYNCRSLTSIVIPDSVTTIGYEAFSWCRSLTNVYYQGTASDWSNISIDYENYKLTNATRYYYSEEAPTATGNWWHYNEQGEVVVWGSDN